MWLARAGASSPCPRTVHFMPAGTAVYNEAPLACCRRQAQRSLEASTTLFRLYCNQMQVQAVYACHEVNVSHSGWDVMLARVADPVPVALAGTGSPLASEADAAHS